MRQQDALFHQHCSDHIDPAGVAFSFQGMPYRAICDREAYKHILRDTLNDSYIYLHVNHEDIP